MVRSAYFRNKQINKYLALLKSYICQRSINYVKISRVFIMENKEERNVHDFLTVSEMDNFNDKVKMVLASKKPVDKPYQKPEPEPEVEPVDRESIIVNPTELTEDILYQLADIIDGKTHFSENDVKEEEPEGPSTVDKINNAIAVAYITEEGLPVAVSILQDPTIENYKYIIPIDYYELKSGVSLKERIQQEYFSFKPDTYTPKVGQELKQLLVSNSPKLFVVNISVDEITNKYLEGCGYKMVSSFDTEWEENPVNLWIN